MQIILHRHVAEEVAKRHTVLELETLIVEDQVVEAFCVVTADRLKLDEFPDLEKNKRLHEDFVAANNKKDYESCRKIAKDLYGKFGGELDSFYDEILSRTK